MFVWPSSFIPLPHGLPPFILFRDNTSRSNNENYSQRVGAIPVIGKDHRNIRARTFILVALLLSLSLVRTPLRRFVLSDRVKLKLTLCWTDSNTSQPSCSVSC